MADFSKYGIGLVTDEFDEHAQYAGMLCFPYITTLGGVVSLKFRRAHECTEGCTHARFISPYPTRLYNTPALDQADKIGYVCITEGEIDCLILNEMIGLPGQSPAVGVPGVETWKAHPEWRELFRGYSKVFVFADSDEPGLELAKTIRKEIDTAEIVTLPGKDVNDTYLRFGPKVIRERINV